MLTEIFTICDYAQDNGSGKLTIVGTFDRVNSPVFPCAQPCALALRMRFSDKEQGSHTGNIRIKNVKGENLFPEIKFDFNVPTIVQDNYASTNMVFNFSNLPIKEPGKIVIELYIDDEWQTGLTLNSQKIPIAA